MPARADAGSHVRLPLLLPPRIPATTRKHCHAVRMRRTCLCCRRHLLRFCHWFICTRLPTTPSPVLLHQFTVLVLVRRKPYCRLTPGPLYAPSGSLDAYIQFRCAPPLHPLLFCLGSRHRLPLQVIYRYYTTVHCAGWLPLRCTVRVSHCVYLSRFGSGSLVSSCRISPLPPTRSSYSGSWLRCGYLPLLTPTCRIFFGSTAQRACLLFPTAHYNIYLVYAHTAAWRFCGSPVGSRYRLVLHTLRRRGLPLRNIPTARAILPFFIYAASSALPQAPPRGSLPTTPRFAVLLVLPPAGLLLL